MPAYKVLGPIVDPVELAGYGDSYVINGDYAWVESKRSFYEYQDPYVGPPPNADTIVAAVFIPGTWVIVSGGPGPPGPPGPAGPAGAPGPSNPIIQLLSEAAEFLSVGPFPSQNKADNAFPDFQLIFTPASNQEAYWKFIAKTFGASNVSITVDVYWYSSTAVAGDVDFGVSVASMAAGDAGAVSAKTFAAESTVTTAVLTVTAGRLNRSTIVVANIDGMANNSLVWLKLRCLDTSTALGTIVVTAADVTYSSS